MPRNTFIKVERLKSKKLIGELFDRGTSVEVPLLRIIFIPTETESSYPAQASFSASKRNFPRAVDRNRIKRLMREAYRLQKTIFYSFLDEKKIQLALIIIFTGRKIPDYKQIEQSISAGLQALKEQL